MSDMTAEQIIAAAAHAREAEARAAALAKQRKALRAENHAIFWERARPWLVFLGATGLTAISTYVMAYDDIQRVAAGKGTPVDGLIIGLVIVLGLMLDASIVISGLRVQQDKGVWRLMASIIFVTCITVEAMTLAYFFLLIARSSVPVWVQSWIEGIHDLLFFFRSGLPPVAIAFLSVGVRNLVFTVMDRKRKMMEEVSVRLLDLEARLSDPLNTENKGDLVREYEGQTALFEYASDATQAERDQNKLLIDQFKATWGLTEPSPEITQLREAVSDAQRQLDAMRREVEQSRQKAQEEKESGIRDAWNKANDMLVKALLFVSNRGELPDSMKEQFPDLAELTFAPQAHTRPQRPARQVSPGSSDDLREAASAAGVEKFVESYAPKDAKDVPVMKDGQPVMKAGKPVTKRETKRTYGVWIRSSDVQLFAGEKLDADEVRQIIIAAGDSAKDGTTYVAPLKGVLRELSKRKKLNSSFVRFVDSANDSSQSATESTEDQGEQS